MKTKTCPDCEEEKPHSEYYVARARKDGIATYCKPCANVRNEHSKLKRKQKKAGIRTAEVIQTTTAEYKTMVHNSVHRFQPRKTVRWI